MRYALLLLLVIVSILPFALTGCETAAGSGPTLVGKWQTDGASGGMGFTYIFGANGVMQRAASMGAMTNPETGTWQTDAWDGVTMTISCTYEVGRKGTMSATDNLQIEFRDNDHITMTLLESGQMPEYYVRVPWP